MDFLTIRLRPTQLALSPTQLGAAQRFIQERIEAQLSTEPVDEPETEALLRDAYVIGRRPPPRHIHWVDGPLQLTAALALQDMKDNVWWGIQNQVKHRVDREMKLRVDERLRHSVWGIMHLVHRSVRDSVGNRVRQAMQESLDERVAASLRASVRDHTPRSKRKRLRADVRANMSQSVWSSVRAYEDAGELAFYRFFDEYLEPNDLAYLAHFNERISGYWLGKREAILVRRPRLLARDAQGRLHSARGKCMEYHDGWGFYAWHGVRVSEQVILAPETLTREDFLNAPNLEVRRVFQERMGERFISELGGRAIDTGPRGTLYEVRLPDDDPERVAHYVEVQDASTERRYFLRVPPTIQTAAEAVAWTFQIPAAYYRPAQET